MARPLPIRIIREIEQRCERRSNARQQAEPGKNVDRSWEHCPLCCTFVLIESATPSNPVSRSDYNMQRLRSRLAQRSPLKVK